MKIIRKYIYPITVVLLILIIIYLLNIKKTLKEDSIVTYSKEEDIFKEEEKNEIVDTYKVDIKGAVAKPGLYEVPKTYVVYDVIKEAGGLTKNADTSLINLSKKIVDEMVIIIYTKDEVKKSNIKDTVIKIVEKECICPNIQNDSCINNEITDTITNQVNSLININTASLEELTTIKGLGESKAKAIIEYRKNNKFNKIEDIMNVSGIGSSLYETIKIYITT